MNEMKKIEFKKSFHYLGTVEFSHEILYDLLVTALDSGSTGWYENADYEIPAENQKVVAELSGNVYQHYLAPFYGGKLTLEVKATYRRDQNANCVRIAEDIPMWNIETKSYEPVTNREGTTWVIREQDLVRGFNLLSARCPRLVSKLIADNGGAYYGGEDVFLQLVCFGKVIY